MNTTMRAMVIDRCGGPEELHLSDLLRPEPGPGEVLIEVACAGLNPADWKTREGWLSAFFQYQFPFVLGFDLAGTVSRIGAGVSGCKVGDRVVVYSQQGLGRPGSYAEFALAFFDGVAHLPDSVGFAQAAAMPTAACTAWEGLFESGRVAAGQKVLIHGGAGGVGSYAIQLARHAGAAVAATCGPGNLAHVRELGAELAIDYREGKVRATLATWAPQGVDLVLDAVGQGCLPDAVEMVKPGGVIAPIATLIAGETPHDAARAAQRGVRIVPTMSSYERSGAQLRALVDLLGRGVLRAPPIELLPLAQAAEAQRRIRAGHVRGKLVLQVAETLA